MEFQEKNNGPLKVNIDFFFRFLLHRELLKFWSGWEFTRHL